MSEGGSIDAVPHWDFAKRLLQATDAKTDIPPLNRGRLTWVRDTLQKRHKIVTSTETVRKWYAGVTLPRKKTLACLADILDADPAWLAMGRFREFDRRKAKLRNAEADSIVNVIAGFIGVHGSTPAFPSEDDLKAKENLIDIYAIVRGVQYSLHICLGVDVQGGWQFEVPFEAKNAVVLGVASVSPFSLRIFELDWHFLDQQTRFNGHFVANVSHEGLSGDKKIKELTSFAERW